MSKVNWKGRVRESGRWPSRFSSQNPWSCSSTVAHKHSAVFSFPRGKAVFFLPDFPHVWQTWPLLHKHYSIKKYVFLQTYLHCFNWIRLTMNLHWSTEINMRNHFIYGQIIKVYLKKKKKRQWKRFLFHKEFSEVLRRRKKSRFKRFYGVKWVLTMFLDCCCSKRPHKCQVAEWYISVHKYHTSKWQVFQFVRDPH